MHLKFSRAVALSFAAWDCLSDRLNISIFCIWNSYYVCVILKDVHLRCDLSTLNIHILNSWNFSLACGQLFRIVKSILLRNWVFTFAAFENFLTSGYRFEVSLKMAILNYRIIDFIEFVYFIELELFCNLKSWLTYIKHTLLLMEFLNCLSIR